MSSPPDVIVIGLGAMGSATVWQLARRGRRVLGIDRWHPPHVHGSTHGETRLTRIAIGEGAEYAPFAIRSHQIWRELEQAAGRDLFRQNGLLIYGNRGDNAAFHGNADFFGTTLRVAEQVFGSARPLLSAPDIRARFPQFHVDPDEAGYYEPEAGMLFPEACVAAQLMLAQKRGADLRTGETVLSIVPRGGTVRVTTDGGAYEAARVVVSAGAWVSQFVPQEWARLFSVTRQVLSWFEPAGHADDYLSSRMPNFIRLPADGAPLVYGFPRINETVADMKVAVESSSPACQPDRVDRSITVDELAALHRFAARTLDLKPAATRAATCLYTVTPGSRFVIDRHPEWPEVMVVSPCSGHGFKHSAAIGECVAMLVSGEPSPIDLSPFAFDRLEK